MANADHAKSPPPPAQPGISVVIPCYNYARFLAFAVDSCLAQDYPDFEVIVVDDGSKDETPAVAARYLDRIRYIRQDNAGLPAARNTGITNARKPFIAFLDADDQFKPGHFAGMMGKMQRLPASFGLLAPDYEYIDAGGTPLGNRRFDPDWERQISAADIIMRTRFPPSGVLARREVFDKCGLFDLPLRSSEDRDMWIRVAAHYKVWRMDNALVQIRKHGSNMSSNAARMKANMLIVLAKARRANVVPASDFCFWLRAHSFLYNQTALIYAGTGHPWQGFRDMIRSLLLWPWHPGHARLDMPPLFRVRSLARWIRDAFMSKPSQ